MSYDGDRIAFYTELNTTWGDTTPIRFDFIQEDDQITKQKEPWIHCNIKHTDTQQANMGVTNVLDRTPGMFLIDIYNRQEKGIAQILKYADTLKTAFMGKSLNSGSIRVIKISILDREPYMGWISKRVLIHFESEDYVART